MGCAINVHTGWWYLTLKALCYAFVCTKLSFHNFSLVYYCISTLALHNLVYVIYYQLHYFPMSMCHICTSATKLWTLLAPFSPWVCVTLFHVSVVVVSEWAQPGGRDAGQWRGDQVGEPHAAAVWAVAQAGAHIQGHGEHQTSTVSTNPPCPWKFLL